MTSLRWENVRAWRLARHHLTKPAKASDALKVVADLAGLHAQVASSAELTLWARVDHLERDAVQKAVEQDRTLIKTWAMRGTLHLLPGHEFATWQAAQRTRTHYTKPSWYRGFGITAEELEQVIEAVHTSLDNAMLTREELAETVGKVAGAHVGDKLRDGFGAVLKPAAFQGQVAFGPNDGQRVRFVRPDQWLQQPDLLDADPASALEEVFRRYLTASGPSTRDELARWWGAQPAEAGRVLKRLGDEVQPVDVEGTPAFALTAHLPKLAKAKPPKGNVKLLPAFDQYVVTATRQAEHFLPGPYADRVYRPQGWLSPVVLVDGRMDGVWKHEVKGRSVNVTVEPFVRLTKPTRQAVETEAARLADHLGGELRLDWIA